MVQISREANFSRVLSCKSCQFKTSQMSHLKKHVDSIHKKFSRNSLNLSMAKRCLEEEFNRSRQFESRKKEAEEVVVKSDDKGSHSYDVKRRLVHIDDVTRPLVHIDDVTCTLCNDTFEFAYLLDLHCKTVHEVIKKSKSVVKTNFQSKKKECYKKLF